MAGSIDIKNQIVAAIPSLRAFAISLIGDRDRADDIVQDTILRALSHIDSFEPGTNLDAWLFTILRNAFYTDIRKRRREVEDSDGAHAARLSSPPAQEGSLLYNDFLSAFAKLKPEQREALLLVVASGFSFEDAATVMGVAVGTAKSRVIRARARLVALLEINPNEDLGPDRATMSVMHATS